MDLSSSFKRDYFNYLISIILPALINAVSIPLFKHILGADGYGNFSITFNSTLLLAALLTGWIMQSILRYSSTVQDKFFFIKKSFRLALITQALFFFPVLFSVFYLKGDWGMAFFFAATLFAVSIQFTALSVSQSFFLSKQTIYSELIRVISYISIVLLLLSATGIFYMYSLFTGIFISYLFSFLYLFMQVKKVLAVQYSETGDPERTLRMFRSFMSYGGPISLWFVFTYLIALIDKYFMLHTLGREEQGNYQAMFDFLSKSITLLSSPVITSLLPLVTVAYQSKKTSEIKKLLSRIIAIELGVLVAALILYWWFGAALLSYLIKIPLTTEYKLMGSVIIAGTFIWQIAMVVHKYHELKFKSGYLLVMVAVAFASQLLLYWAYGKNAGRMLYPSGYALAAVVYLLLVSTGALRSFFNFKKLSNNAKVRIEQNI